LRAKTRHARARMPDAVLECFLAKHGRRVRAAGQRRNAAGEAVEMEPLDRAIDRLVRPGKLAGQQVDRILGQAAGLIFCPRKREVAGAHSSTYFSVTAEVSVGRTFLSALCA